MNKYVCSKHKDAPYVETDIGLVCKWCLQEAIFKSQSSIPGAIVEEFTFEGTGVDIVLDAATYKLPCPKCGSNSMTSIRGTMCCSECDTPLWEVK